MKHSNLILTLILIFNFIQCGSNKKNGIFNFLPLLLMNKSGGSSSPEPQSPSNVTPANPEDTTFSNSGNQNPFDSTNFGGGGTPSITPPLPPSTTNPTIPGGSTFIDTTALVKAFVVKPNKVVDRFQDIVVEFTENMERSTICNGEIATGLTFRNITDSVTIPSNMMTCKWATDRQLIINPYQALLALKTYRISINPSIGKPLLQATPTRFFDSFTNSFDGTFGGSGNDFIFQTEPAFVVTYSISHQSNTYTLNENIRGLNLDTILGGAQNVFLSVSNSDFTLAKNIYLKKVGGGSYTVCTGTCPASLFSSYNLNSNPAITPSIGMNSYYLEIQIEVESNPQQFKTYYKTFNFNLGNHQQVASGFSPDGLIEKAGMLVLDKNPNPANQSTLDVLGFFLEHYAEKSFDLRRNIFGFPTQETLNDLLKRGSSNQMPYTGTANCMNWNPDPTDMPPNSPSDLRAQIKITTQDLGYFPNSESGKLFQPNFSYITKVGPFCNNVAPEATWNLGPLIRLKFSYIADVFINKAVVGKNNLSSQFLEPDTTTAPDSTLIQANIDVDNLDGPPKLKINMNAREMYGDLYAAIKVNSLALEINFLIFGWKGVDMSWLGLTRHFIYIVKGLLNPSPQPLAISTIRARSFMLDDVNHLTVGLPQKALKLNTDYPNINSPPINSNIKLDAANWIAKFSTQSPIVMASNSGWAHASFDPGNQNSCTAVPVNAYCATGTGGCTIGKYYFDPGTWAQPVEDTTNGPLLAPPKDLDPANGTYPTGFNINNTSLLSSSSSLKPAHVISREYNPPSVKKGYKFTTRSFVANPVSQVVPLSIGTEWYPYEYCYYLDEDVGTEIGELFGTPLTWIANVVINAILKDAVDQQVAILKPKLIIGLLRDFVETVASDLFNALLDPLRQGVSLSFPKFVPEPIKSMNLNLAIGPTVEIGNPNLVEIDTNGSKGLVAPVDIKLTTTNSLLTGAGNNCNQVTDVANGKCPPSPTGTITARDSFIRTRANINVRTPNPLKFSSANPGALLGIHSDSVGQFFYTFWKNGGLNMRLDKPFLDQLKTYRPSENNEPIRLLETLLKAKNFMAILSPENVDDPALNEISGEMLKFHNGSSYITVMKEDDIYLLLRPLQTPFVTTDQTSIPGSGTYIPKLKLALADVEVQVWGKPVLGGSDYRILSFRLSLHTKANFNIGKFDGADIINSNSTLVSLYGQESNNRLAIKLDICDDQINSNVNANDCDGISGIPTNVFYSLAVVNRDWNNQIANPSGFSPTGISKVLDTIIKPVFIPVFNYVLGEIPLPLLGHCGIEVNQRYRKNPLNPVNAKILPIDFNSIEPYFLINARTEIFDNTLPIGSDSKTMGSLTQGTPPLYRGEGAYPTSCNLIP